VKRLILLLLAFACLLQSTLTFASAPLLVGNAVFGAVAKQLIRRGFAANDPRWAKTFAAVAAEASRTYGTSAAARSWGGYALLALGVGGTLSLSTDSFDTVTKTGANSVQPSAPPPVPLVAGLPVWKSVSGYYFKDPSNALLFFTNAGYYAWNEVRSYGGELYSSAQPMRMADPNFWYEQIDVNTVRLYFKGYPVFAPGSSSAGKCWDLTSQPCTVLKVETLDLVNVNAPISCTTGVSTGSSCTPSNNGVSGIGSPPSRTFDAQLTRPPVNPLLPVLPQVIEDLANGAYQRAAAQPGFDGFPYNMDDPVAAGDVQKWKDEFGAIWPTVGDMLNQPASSVDKVPPVAPVSSGAPADGTAPAPSTDPVPEPAPGSASSPAIIDFGPDPNVRLSDPEVPTAASILKPLLDLLPQYRNWSAPAPSSVTCPVYNITWWKSEGLDRTVLVDWHCDLYAQHRDLLRRAAMVLWTIAVIFIILAA
jgi:hypothetical protein